MWFVLFAFVVPSVFCALLGLYLCVQHQRIEPCEMDESIMLLHQKPCKDWPTSPTKQMIGSDEQWQRGNNSITPPSPFANHPPPPPPPHLPQPHHRPHYFPPCSPKWRMPSPMSSRNATIGLDSPLMFTLALAPSSSSNRHHPNFPCPPILCPPPPAYSAHFTTGGNCGQEERRKICSMSV